MEKRTNKRRYRSTYLRAMAFTISLLVVAFQPVLGAMNQVKLTVTEIINGKEQFMSTLASMPYTSSGKGPVLYMLEFSECPYCQAFERDWKGQLGGVEIRRFFYAVSERTANETAYLAQTRNIDDFHAFMNRTKVAPNIRTNNAAIDAQNTVMEPLQNIIMPIMIKNGWPGRTPKSPQFMWKTNGRVYVHGGYSKESAKEILGMVRSGTTLPHAVTHPTRSTTDH
jgi:hypothetical protein